MPKLNQGTAPFPITLATGDLVIGRVKITDGTDVALVTGAGRLSTDDTNTSDIKTAVQLIDDVVATDGAAALTKGNQVCGTDGTNAQIISTGADGKVNVADGGASLTVDGTFFQVTQPVSATNLDIRNLAPATDEVKIGDGTHTADIDATSRLTVSVDNNPTLAALPAGTNNIGDVDVATIAAGDTNIGNVDIVTIPNTIIAGMATLPAGTNAIGKLAANNGVDIGDVDVKSVIPGTGSTSLGKAEDAAHATGHTGVAVWGVRDDTLGIFSGTEGDYEPFHMTAQGRLYTSATVDAALPAGANAIGKLAANSGIDIGDVDILSIAAGDNNIGNVDVASLPATPTGTNIIGAVKRDIVNYTKVWKYVALADTNETTIWDPTAGKKFVATDIFVSATAAGTCTLRDGTAGTTFLIAGLAATGGFVTNLQTPIQSSTADNILTAQASAATQYITICGYEV